MEPSPSARFRFAYDYNWLVAALRLLDELTLKYEGEFLIEEGGIFEFEFMQFLVLEKTDTSIKLKKQGN